MKRIILKQLSLTNFKGARSLQASFDAGVTRISGRNGSGKTTLFDAFTWLLFGKDSLGRKQFDIKTLDSKGTALQRLPHEVSAVLEVDGKETRLARRFCEKWTKKRGSATEEFAGHEEERLYNDVPCSLKEWNEKIASICQEDAFKFLTSPAAFTSQKAETQRALLIKMAGGFSDNEVVAKSGQRQDFIELLGKLGGKTIEEYKREIGAKKKIIKAEVDGLPERIDERKRDNAGYEATDYAQVEAEIQQKQQAASAIDGKLLKASELVREASKEREGIASELAKTREGMGRIRHETSQKMSQGYYDSCKAQADAKYALSLKSIEASRLATEISQLQASASGMAERRNALMEEMRRIKAQRLEFGMGDFICPTCGQPLDPDNIEKKKAEMQESFNQRIQSQLEENKRKGMQCSRFLIAEATEKMQAAAAKREALMAEMENLKQACQGATPAQKPTEEEIDERTKSSEEYKALAKREQELAAALDAQSTPDIDTAELMEAKRMLADSISELKALLAGRQALQRNNERIKELEQRLRSQSEELAKLEQTEFAISEFSKARIEAVEGKINSLFELVRFKMFDTQINGGEVETCEAMVGGVPYSSLNNAMRINAGLDIINAICRYQGACAPIFIDNCESVLGPIETIGQQIRLIVADKALTIE